MDKMAKLVNTYIAGRITRKDLNMQCFTLYLMSSTVTYKHTAKNALAAVQDFHSADCIAFRKEWV